jgi:hypothetical protein
MVRIARPTGYYEKNVREDCGRCSGSGSVSWGIDVKGAVHTNRGVRIVERVCFTCNGVGYKMRSQANIDRAEKAREKKAREVFTAAQAEATQKAAAWAAWTAEHADVIEFLETARAGEPGTFVFEMKDAIAWKQALTERQVQVVRRIAEQQRAEAAVSTQVIEGRIEVTGEVITTKEQDTMYGLTVKMLVRDDRGFKVWGTVPSTLLGEGVKGKRVAFTAKIEASRDDATFGFYSRPTKARIVS